MKNKSNILNKFIENFFFSGDLARARTGPPPGGRGPNAPLEKVDRVSSGEFRGAFEILSAVSSFILSNFKVVRRNFFQ